ncbi:MAG: electron transfer flavoprotein subunit alpha/FixB family protein [Planctomycetota bacterium]
MPNHVVVFIECRDGAVHKSCWQTVSAGRKLADSLGGQCVAVTVGGPGSAAAAATAGKYGAQKVRAFESGELTSYSGEGFSRAIAAEAATHDPAAVLFSATAMGRDLAPRVAARLGRSVSVDCTGISVNSGNISVVRPVLAGKANQSLAIAGHPAVVSLRPNAFPADEVGADVAAESFSADLGTLRDKVASVAKAEAGRIDVADADIIVSGGRGLGDNANYEKLVMPLCQVLGAANGASRAIVDAGWRPHGEQVGQTGKTVSPRLYIAIGISGAIQHKAGMDTARCIVAINKDKDAAIFKFADYGIVGDVNEVVPALTDKLKALLG